MSFRVLRQKHLAPLKGPRIKSNKSRVFGWEDTDGIPWNYVIMQQEIYADFVSVYSLMLLSATSEKHMLKSTTTITAALG